MEFDFSNIVACVGIDWADQKHDVSLASTPGKKFERQQIKHTPEALSDWLLQLRKRFPQGHIAVCLEQSRGALLYHLLGYDFLLLYPVNPKTLARYREAFSNSGAKDDGPDADFLCELICCHRDRLRPWAPDDPQTRSLSFHAEARRKAVDERTRISNKLQSELKMYFPQALELTGENLYDKMSLAFLQRWPSLKDIQRVRDETIRKFYTQNGSRSVQRIETRLELIRAAVPLTTDKAVLSTALITVPMLVAMLVTLNESVSQYEQTINTLFDQHPYRDIFTSFPGAGNALAPRLLAAWGNDRNRYEDAEAMQKYSGVAPITKRSGKSSVVQRRLACPKFLRQTFHEFANCSLRSSTWAKAYYDMLRSRGKSHNSSVRSLAFKWIRIMYRCWRDGVCYVENTYIKALQRSNAPLLSSVAQ